VACTGAISDEFFHRHTGPIDEGPGPLDQPHGPQWKPPTRYDLVTFSFGGDDIGFQSILVHCRTSGCPNTAVRKKIAQLGTTGVYKGSLHIPPLPTFYQHVATAAVITGGNVVVMGYPELFADPSDWPSDQGSSCAGFSKSKIETMRGWAADLNATIGESVAKVNAEPASERNEVHFTFINPVTGGGYISASDPNLFERAGGTSHELCATGHDTWMNGFSETNWSGSFHPNQEGENAMGALVAEVIPKLVGPLPPVSDSSQTAQLLTNLLRSAGLLTSQAPPSSCADIELYGADFAHEDADLLIGHASEAGCKPVLPFGTLYQIRTGRVSASTSQCDCGQQSQLYLRVTGEYQGRGTSSFHVGTSGSLVVGPFTASPSSATTSTTSTAPSSAGSSPSPSASATITASYAPNLCWFSDGAMASILGEPVTGPVIDGDGCDWETALTPYHLLAGLSPDLAEPGSCDPTFNTNVDIETPEPNGCINVGSADANGGTNIDGVVGVTVTYGGSAVHLGIDAIGPVSQIEPSVVENLQAAGMALYQLLAVNPQADSDLSSAGGSTGSPSGSTGTTGSTGNT
jgi:hypothetical protein